MPNELSARSRSWEKETRPRYWWHSLPGMDYVPPIYSDMTNEEWTLLREWYEETNANGAIGECAVPLISLLHGLVMGNRPTRLVQLGTCSGYSALLLGFMLRRMKVRPGLFTIDFGKEMCAFTQKWMERAGLTNFVKVAELNSMDVQTPRKATEFLDGPPEMIILDTSHEYRATLAELDLWYPELAAGGLMVLHDVSRFATDFDVTGEGGVRRAFDEWRKAHPEAETFCLNGESRTMNLPRPFYKDACGVGLIHKPGIPQSQRPNFIR